MKLGEADAGALHVAEQCGFGAPELLEIKRAERVVEHVDANALAGLFAKQIGEGVSGVVVGPDVGLEADAMACMLDGFEGGVQRFAVLVELEARAIVEMDRRGNDPAVIGVAGGDVQAGGSSPLALARVLGGSEKGCGLALVGLCHWIDLIG